MAMRLHGLVNRHSQASDVVLVRRKGPFLLLKSQIHV